MTIIHDSKGVVSEQELVKLENLLGINLPKDYRGFLKSIMVVILSQMDLILQVVMMGRA